MLSGIAGDRMNALYLTTYGIGVPFHLYVTKTKFLLCWALLMTKSI